MCSKSESGFWFHFEKYRGWRVQILLGTRKQYSAASIQTCVHPWRLGKVERFSTKLMSSSLVAEKERTQSGGPTSWQTWPYLQLFSKRFPCGARTQFYPNLYWEKVQSTVSRMKKIQDIHITTTCASFVSMLCICMALNDWKKKLHNRSIYSSIKWMDWAPINSKESTWTIFLLLKIC